MKRLAMCLGVVAVGWLLPATAFGQVGLELSPYPGSYGGEVIEVPPGDVETLWFHIMADGGLWHVQDYCIDFDFEPSGPEPPAWGELIDPLIQPSIEYTGCEWYPFGVIQIDGPPCTYVNITASITVQQPTGTITSNTIIKHIVPEPGTMIMLATGVLFGMLLLRRRQ